MESREHQFEKFYKKYEAYEIDKASLIRLEKEQEELTEKQNQLVVLLSNLREQKAVLNDQMKEYQESK